MSISALILENPSYSSDLTYKTILATELSNNKYNQQVKASVKLDAKVFNYYKNTSYNRFALFDVFPEANGNASKHCFILLEAAVAILVLLLPRNPQ